VLILVSDLFRFDVYRDEHDEYRVSVRGIRSTRNRCMAPYVICNFASNFVPILISNVSISIFDYAFRRRGYFYPNGRIEHKSGLQSSVYQADYFHVQRSVSFLVTKYDLQNEQILWSSCSRFEVVNYKNIISNSHKFYTLL